jgi:hypothetical protein
MTWDGWAGNYSYDCDYSQRVCNETVSSKRGSVAWAAEKGERGYWSLLARRMGGVNKFPNTDSNVEPRVQSAMGIGAARVSHRDCLEYRFSRPTASPIHIGLHLPVEGVKEFID